MFFRDTCRRMAAAVGVAGWVRNTPDGRVEAWFEGDRAGVDRMVAWCREGPPGARVTDVEVVPETPAGETALPHPVNDDRRRRQRGAWGVRHC